MKRPWVPACLLVPMLLGMTGGVVRVEDFGGYWCGAKINWAGGNPYDAEQVLALEKTIEPERTSPQMPWGTPWSLSLVTPFIAFDFATARWLWLLVQAVAVTAAAAGLWSAYGGSSATRVVSLPFFFLFYPTMLLLGVGQVSLANLLALAGFLFFLERGADFRAGLAIALIAAKAQVMLLVAIVLLVWIVQQRRWKLAVGGLCGMAISTAIVIVPNRQVFAMYVDAMVHRGPTDFIPATPSTLLRFWWGPETFWPALVPLAVGLAWLVVRYALRFRSWDWRREMPALTFACFLSSPYAHNYDLVILLVPLTRAAVVSLNRGRTSFVALFALVFLASVAAAVMNQWEWEEYEFMWFSPVMLVIYVWFCRSTVTEKKLLTAEEFFLLPDPSDGSEQELFRGEIITMPPPGGMHGVSCLKAGRRLGNFVEDNDRGTVTSNDTGFITERAPDSVRGPDIAYWSKDRLPAVPVGYIEIAPDMLVEVLSPSNTSKQIRTKLKEHFAKGVRLVWVLAPEDRTLTVYRTLDEGRVLHEPATVTGEDVLPGFSCRVGDLLP